MYGIDLTASVMIGTDCTCRCKSKYHYLILDHCGISYYCKDSFQKRLYKVYQYNLSIQFKTIIFFLKYLLESVGYRLEKAGIFIIPFDKIIAVIMYKWGAKYNITRQSNLLKIDSSCIFYSVK